MADVDMLRRSSPIPLSREMTLLLCLVIFDGYTIGGVPDADRLARARPDNRGEDS